MEVIKMSRKNLGIIGSTATHLRINNRGVIQFSIDNAETWKNIRDIRDWINLYVGPLDDLDGDGSGDNIIGELESIKKQLEELSGASAETIESIQERLSVIEKYINGINITIASSESIQEMFKED